MTASAVLAKLKIPPIILGVEVELSHSLKQFFHSLLTLRAADKLTYTGNEHIRCSNGLAVVVLAHIECLDILGIIGYEYGLFKYLLRKISLVLCLKIHTPIYGVFKCMTAVLKLFNRFCIGNSTEITVHKSSKTVDESLIHEIVEEFHLCLAVFHYVGKHEFHHILSGIHIVGKIRKGKLRLNHPEFRRVSLSI